VVIALPVVTDRNGTLASGRLGLSGPTGTFSLPATFRGEMAELVVAAPSVTRAGTIPPGHYELTAHLGSGDSPGLPVGAAHVRHDGRFVVIGVTHEPVLTRLAGWAGWYADILREETTELRAGLRSRVVRPVRVAIRSALGRARG
jgi:hypothetical protein